MLKAIEKHTSVKRCQTLCRQHTVNKQIEVQMIQNVAARLVFNQPKRAHVTPLLIELHWLLAARIKFKSRVLAYRVIAGSAPTYLNALVRAKVNPQDVALV